MASQSVSAQEFLKLAQAQLQRIERARGELADARKEHDRKVRELEAARAAALDELAAACLPELTPEAVARVKAEAGYGRFAREDPFAAMARLREALEARVRQIEADERYVRREALLDPVTGELTLEVERLARDLDQLTGPLDRYRKEPRFLELIRGGYDTEAYAVSRWRLQYYRDWKWGDIFCERFGQTRFAQVRDAYVNLENGYRTLLADVEAARRRVEEVRALSTEHDDAKRQLSTLDEDTLASCRQLLREHLEYIDRAELAGWMAADPTRVALVKRLHGIERKIEYLGELATREFGNEEESLGRSAAKLRRKTEKYRRPKHAYARIPASDARLWLHDPTDKLGERRARFRRDYETVYVFDRYDAFDYARDMLWWDLMTGGRIDGGFIPEVSAWRAERPDYAGPDLSRAGGAYSPASTPDWGPDAHEVS